MRTIIAIDPGASGGIAIHNSTGIVAMKMPDTLADIRDVLEQEFLLSEKIVAYCEKVGTYMPGNSGPSAATFAEHVGALKGIICAVRIPVRFVTPNKWMVAFIGKQSYPEKKDDYEPKVWKAILAKRKQLRKNLIKAKAQELYPHLKVTLATSDALGILHYGIQQERESATHPQDLFTS